MTIYKEYDFSFSIQENTCIFNLKYDTKVTLAQGYADVAKKSIRADYIDDLSIEYLIFHIEETLEALIKQVPQLNKKPIHVQSADHLLFEICTLFFQKQICISRSEMEHAFNQFYDQLSHFNLTLADKNSLITYFVFLREMMHHLNIETINYNASL